MAIELQVTSVKSGILTILSLAGALALVSTAIASAAPLLEEDWTDTSDWLLWSQDGDTDHVPRANATEGVPPPSLDPRGGGPTPGQAGFAQHSTFEASYVGSGIRIEMDAKVDSKMPGVEFGLGNQETGELLVEMYLNWGENGGQVVGQLWNSDGTSRESIISQTAPCPIGPWYSAGFEIQPDQTVIFFVNDATCLTSTQTVDPYLDGRAPVFIEGYRFDGQAFVDNLLITPEPATLALVVLNGLALLRRRR